MVFLKPFLRLSVFVPDLALMIEALFMRRTPSSGLPQPALVSSQDYCMTKLGGVKNKTDGIAADWGSLASTTDNAPMHACYI